ncbi:MAG: hypothetical protein Q9159_003180 [Coniocarpon cinnabarinum]
MSTLPLQQSAMKTDGGGKASIHHDVPIPQIPPNGYILVRTSYVGLNPTDWKHIDGDFAGDRKPGFTVGCDYAGTIVQVGPNVTKPLHPGDRVAGFSHGVKSNNPESGAFAQYIIAKADIAFKIPPSISDAEAAAYGVGLLTNGQALYQSLDLPWPSQPSTDKTPVLIYGGSTGMAIFAVQFAKLSGLRVVTTCSPRNFEFVKNLGADEVFDYKSEGDAMHAEESASDIPQDPNCASNIRKSTNNALKHAYDTISDKTSSSICANALSSNPGVKYSALLPSGPNSFPRTDAALKTYTWGYTATGEEFFSLGETVTAKPENFEFMKGWIAECERLAAERKFVVTPTVREGGLQGVFEGLEDLKMGRVSAEKLVYRV